LLSNKYSFPWLFNYLSLKEGRMVFNYKKNRAWAESLHIVMQIGLTMAGCIIFCFFIGLYLDKWLGTKGLFVVVFVVLGIIGGGITVYRQILDVTSDNIEDKENPENGIR
jgi:F0F1-type ATP synthase assembly protein I